MLKKQREVMVNYMVGHRNVAVGTYEGALGKVTMENNWRELRDLLKLHGPDKTEEQWKKAWRDLKGKTRAKNARLNSERTATGNTPGHTPPLNEVEKLVLTVIGVETSTPAVELGIPLQDNECVQAIVEEDLPLQTEVIVLAVKYNFVSYMRKDD
ncbi:uncharacterized protein LOC124173150 [Ischnura elegans]|uniref:uncharacterized protein LOC124173150 n=1 Tax=Ischnura elegans TaxID=197161 RepID=UPI001ED89208|nr:uncharacterized protein LOC124173150 [Ischnura elegans]